MAWLCGEFSSLRDSKRRSRASSPRCMALDEKLAWSTGAYVCCKLLLLCTFSTILSSIISGEPASDEKYSGDPPDDDQKSSPLRSAEFWRVARFFLVACFLDRRPEGSFFLSMASIVRRTLEGLSGGGPLQKSRSRCL